MGKWKTVPNSFPNPEDIDAEGWYHLREGFGIYDYKMRHTGGYYKKIKVDGDFHQLLSLMGFGNWWTKMKPDRTFWGRFFNSWTKK